MFAYICSFKKNYQIASCLTEISWPWKFTWLCVTTSWTTMMCPRRCWLCTCRACLTPLLPSTSRPATTSDSTMARQLRYLVFDCCISWLIFWLFFLLTCFHTFYRYLCKNWPPKRSKVKGYIILTIKWKSKRKPKYIFHCIFIFKSPSVFVLLSTCTISLT